MLVTKHDGSFLVTTVVHYSWFYGVLWMLRLWLWWKVKEPDAHSESEKTRFNKVWAGIKWTAKVRVPESHTEGRSKNIVGENTSKSRNREVRFTLITDQN